MQTNRGLRKKTGIKSRPLTDTKGGGGLMSITIKTRLEPTIYNNLSAEVFFIKHKRAWPISTKFSIDERDKEFEMS